MSCYRYLAVPTLLLELTKRIRAGQTAKIGAFAPTLTRYEKTHLRSRPFLFLADPVLSNCQAGAQNA